MDGIFGLLSVVILGSGIYCLYAWYNTRQTGTINETLLLGKAFEVKKCKDTFVFIRKSQPAVLILGITAVVYGGLDVLGTFVLPEDALLGLIRIIGMFIFLVVLVGFMVYTSKLRKDFF
ncbi:MAG: hypothetical protein FWE25_01740 [Lachnospiraceae bacterium]|nr:hypothetical protein [Lachnospiraceae bacterium]